MIITEKSVNYIFRVRLLLALLFLHPALFAARHSLLQPFDKTAFYAALAGTDLAALNLMLTELEESRIPEKSAYEGTLLMKKASLVKRPKEKLSLFRSGRAILESAIKEAEGNIEYRFLRLIIQENAPKIVKYKSALQEDAQMVRSSYNTLPPIIQQAVRDYSKSSTVLKPTDL